MVATATAYPDDETVRQLIVLRFADRLTAHDVDALIPYVRQTLQTSDRLEKLDLGDWDPRNTWLPHDPDDI